MSQKGDETESDPLKAELREQRRKYRQDLDDLCKFRGAIAQKIKAAEQLEQNALARKSKREGALTLETQCIHHRRQRENAKNVEAHNTEKVHEKKALQQKQREEDRVLFERLQNQNAEYDAMERDRRIRVRDDIRAWRDIELEWRQGKRGEDNALELLWQEATDKQWDTMEAHRKAEADAREVKTKSRGVYEARLEQIRVRREQRRAAAEEEKAKDRAELNKEVEMTERKYEERAQWLRAEAIRNMKLNHQQISIRQNNQKMEKELMLEESSQKRVAEELYQTKVQRHLEKLENAKPSQFAHLPLYRANVSGKRFNFGGWL